MPFILSKATDPVMIQVKNVTASFRTLPSPNNAQRLLLGEVIFRVAGPRLDQILFLAFSTIGRDFIPDSVFLPHVLFHESVLKYCKFYSTCCHKLLSLIVRLIFMKKMKKIFSEIDLQQYIVHGS